MTQKSMSYDNPAYQSRLTHGFGQNAAGASTNFSKFTAFTNMVALSIMAAAITAGTSTQTQWNGTGTVVNINGDQFSLIHVINGAAVSTTTHGPFSLATGTGTITTTAGMFTRIQLSGTATTGNAQAGTNTAEGGIQVAAGDTLHILRGTDATAVSAFALELMVAPGANVTAQV
jgi:hypothetical protein